jgi:hypothetical protein
VLTLSFEHELAAAHRLTGFGDQVEVLDPPSVRTRLISTARQILSRDHDFWLFDDTTVVKLLYRPDGTQIGRELLENPDLGAYLRCRDAAWQAAVPFRDFWAGLTTGV